MRVRASEAIGAAPPWGEFVGVAADMGPAEGKLHVAPSAGQHFVTGIAIDLKHAMRNRRGAPSATLPCGLVQRTQATIGGSVPPHGRSSRA